MRESVKSFHGKKVGEKATVLVGPWKGSKVLITEIIIRGGARNGWFTVVLPTGDGGLYAGEELSGSEA